MSLTARIETLLVHIQLSSQDGGTKSNSALVHLDCSWSLDCAVAQISPKDTVVASVKSAPNLVMSWLLHLKAL